MHKKLVKYMALLTLAIMLCLVAIIECSAGDLYLYQFSSHMSDGYDEDGKHKEFESVHPFVGYSTDEGHLVAAFKNSYGDPTVLAGKLWPLDIGNKYVTPYIMTGLTWGYKDHHPNVKGVSPIGNIGVDLHPSHNRWGVNINTVGVVHTIGLRIRIK